MAEAAKKNSDTSERAGKPETSFSVRIRGRSPADDQQRNRDAMSEQLMQISPPEASNKNSDILPIPILPADISL